MTSNVPPEPDEFQTRMRSSADEPSDQTHPSGEQPQFAPPGFEDPSASTQPGYGQQSFGQQSQAPQPSPAGQPAQPQPGPAPQGYGQGFGQQSQAPQGFGQPAGGQQGFGQPVPQAAPQGGFPQGGPFGQQQPGGQQPTGGMWAPKPKDANPFKAAMDFSFSEYATPGIVKIVYIVGVVLAALWYLAAVIVGFVMGRPIDLGFGTYGEYNPIYGILALVFAWIPAVFFVLMLRVGLELTLSNVRTAADVRVLRERSDADAD